MSRQSKFSMIRMLGLLLLLLFVCFVVVYFPPEGVAHNHRKHSWVSREQWRFKMKSVTRTVESCCCNHCCQEPFVCLWGTVTSCEVRRYGMILNVRWTLLRVLKLFSAHFLFFRWPVPLQHLDFILPPKEVTYLASSCTFQYCGNAVQWVEFRAGTRGAIRMRWPSGIFSEWPTCTSLGGVKSFVNYAISVSFKRSIWILHCGQYEHSKGGAGLLINCHRLWMKILARTAQRCFRYHCFRLLSLRPTS